MLVVGLLLALLIVGAVSVGVVIVVVGVVADGCDGTDGIVVVVGGGGVHVEEMREPIRACVRV